MKILFDILGMKIFILHNVLGKTHDRTKKGETTMYLFHKHRWGLIVIYSKYVTVWLIYFRFRS